MCNFSLRTKMSTLICVKCNKELFISQAETIDKVYSAPCGHLLHYFCLKYSQKLTLEENECESFLPWRKSKKKCPKCGKKAHENKFNEIHPMFSTESNQNSTKNLCPVVTASEILNTNEEIQGSSTESWEKSKNLLESEYLSKKQHLEALYQQLLKKTQIQQTFAREKESNAMQLKYQLDDLEREYERTQNHLASEKRRIQQQQQQRKNPMGSQSQTLELRKINQEFEQNSRTFQSERRELEQKLKYLEFDSYRQTELNRDRETLERKLREKQAELDGLKKRLNTYLKTPLP